MTINPKDDYTTLGSLFYPSIEASGNAYYGQTKKLAIDELFNINSGGFSQTVVARPLDGNEKYFSWELGPLKGCLKVFNDFYDSDNIYFAKYNVKVKNEPVIYEVIDSGQFPTYSKSVYVELDKDQPYVIGAINPVTINDPEKAEAWDGRNFYTDVDNKILYIAIAKDSLKKEITKAMTYPSQEELEQPLTFENTGTETTYIRLFKTFQEKNANIYEYRTINKSGNTSEWKQQASYTQQSEDNIVEAFNESSDDTLDVDGSIRLKSGCKVQYRLIGEYSIPTSSLAITKFMTVQRPSPADEPNISLSGNIASMIAQEPEVFSTIKDSSGYTHGHSSMFEECGFIKSAKNLIIPYEIVSFEINFLFNKCRSLLYAPYIYVKKMVRHSYGIQGMFRNCSSLLEPPPILPMVDYIDNDAIYAYTEMFESCSSMHKVPLIPLAKCTHDALDGTFHKCSNLTQLPVILISELNNLYRHGEFWNDQKSLNNAFTDTKIKAIYCAAVLDSNPSSKPKLSKWLPDSIKTIYVPSKCPDNFWESVDANYRGKVTKIDTVMDANEYPQYWTKSASHNISVSNSYTDNSGHLYNSSTMLSPEYFATTIEQWHNQEHPTDQFAAVCAPLGIVIQHNSSHDGIDDGIEISIGDIDSEEQIYVESPKTTVRGKELNLESPNINLNGDYGLASVKDIDTTKTLDINNTSVEYRDSTIMIHSDVNYTDDVKYTKPFITVNSKVSEPLSKVDFDYKDYRFDKSTIGLGIYTESQDNPSASIQLSSGNNPSFSISDPYIYGSDLDRTSNISMRVKNNPGANESSITLSDESNIRISADQVLITDSSGSTTIASFNGLTKTATFGTTVFMRKNPFSNLSVDDAYNHFYAQNGFNISVIAIVLSDFGNYYVCPDDIIRYDRRISSTSPIITFKKAGTSVQSITIDGATRITDASSISDVYLAIMTPSGYRITEFRALGSATFKILSFGQTAPMDNTIYVLVSMEA